MEAAPWRYHQTVGRLPHHPISQMVGSPDRKGQEGVGWGCSASRVAILGPNFPQRKAAGGGGGVTDMDTFCLWPFLQLCFHIWPPAAFISGSLAPHGSLSKTHRHPARAPRRPPRTTHAKGQQENVEQKLDTLHSSFHRHGCWAWGRKRAQGLEQAEGPPDPQLPAGLRSLPCAAPIAALPPRNPQSDPRLRALPALPARRPDWGGGAHQGVVPRDPGTHGGRSRTPGGPPPAAAQRGIPTPTGHDPGPSPAPRARASLRGPHGWRPANFEAKLSPRASPESRGPR